MHMLRAELPKGLAERIHLVEVPHDECERRLEVPLQRRQIGGKQAAQVGRRPKQLLVEARRQLTRPRCNGSVGRPDLTDAFRCHNSRIQCRATEATTANRALRTNCCPKSMTNCANSR